MSKVDLKVDWATYKAAKYACEHWHYSKCLSIGKLAKMGAWENNKFIGCVIFGRGTCGHLVERYGLQPNEGAELTRVALKNHETPVSMILSRSIRMFKKAFPSIKLLVSFASQTEGHHGGIYQANNWIYCGETAHKDEFLYKGRRVPDRVVSGIVRDLRIPRRDLERQGILKRLETKNKYRYLMPLDKKMRKQILPLSKPYPKRVPLEGQQAPPVDGGSTPTHTLQAM